MKTNWDFSDGFIFVSVNAICGFLFVSKHFLNYDTIKVDSFEKIYVIGFVKVTNLVFLFFFLFSRKHFLQYHQKQKRLEVNTNKNNKAI